MTYEQLFSYLNGAGFRGTEVTSGEWVFEHREQKIVLAFTIPKGYDVDATVRDADAASVEYRLQHHDLLVGSLVVAVAEAATAS